MTITLKENYKRKKIEEVAQKVKKADAILNEDNPSYHARLLLEALDEDEYQKATEVIQKLQNISKVANELGLTLISSGIDTSIKDINSFVGGMGLKGLKDRASARLSSLFSKASPSKNPIFKGLSFANSLESGFKNIQGILSNNVKDIEKDSKKSILDLTTNDLKVQKNIENLLIKSFVPTGIFGSLFNKIPYIDDTKGLAKQIMSLNLEQLKKINTSVTSGVKTSDIDSDITDKKANAEVAKDTEVTSQEKTKQSSVTIQRIGSGKVLDNDTKTVLVQQTSTAAKEAGITDGKAFVSLMKNLGYQVGSPEGTLVAATLKELMADKNIPDNQSDGFIRGLMSDFDKEFKDPIKSKITDLISNLKNNLEKAIEKHKEETGSAPESGLVTQAFNNQLKLMAKTPVIVKNPITFDTKKTKPGIGPKKSNTIPGKPVAVTPTLK